MSWFDRKITPGGINFHESGNPADFTPRAQQVLALARKEAEDFNHNFVGTEHVLLGLIKLGQGVAVNVFHKIGLDLETVRTEVQKLIGRGPNQKMVGNIPYTPRVKKALSLAKKEAKALNHTYVGTEHILLGLLREGDGVAARVLKNMNVDIEKFRGEVLKELDPNSYAGKIEVASLDDEPSGGGIDLKKRYDIFSDESGKELVYRNVLIKRVRTLRDDEGDFKMHFLQLEQSNGEIIFLAARLVTKLRAPENPKLGAEPPLPSP